MVISIACYYRHHHLAVYFVYQSLDLYRISSRYYYGWYHCILHSDMAKGREAGCYHKLATLNLSPHAVISKAQDWIAGGAKEKSYTKDWLPVAFIRFLTRSSYRNDIS